MEEYYLLTKCLQWLQCAKKYNSEAQWYCSSGHNLSYIHFEHKSEGEREEKEQSEKDYEKYGISLTKQVA